MVFPKNHQKMGKIYKKKKYTSILFFIFIIVVNYIKSDFFPKQKSSNFENTPTFFRDSTTDKLMIIR